MKILLAILTPLFLLAHSLSVTASYEDKELFIESFFGDGNPCKECPFEVKKDEKKIFESKLDSQGAFENSFDAKPPFDIHIDGGMGHWADVKIDGTEMAEESETMNRDNATMNSIDETKIRQIIRSELNKQNSKIEVMIEKNKSNLEKMLVGLGYILGIFGLWQLFVKPKKK